jgi:hypothetical protein
MPVSVAVPVTVPVTVPVPVTRFGAGLDLVAAVGIRVIGAGHERQGQEQGGPNETAHDP